MRQKTFLFLGIFLSSFGLQAQSDSTFIQLEEVIVSESLLQKFGTGNAISIFDRTSLASSQNSDLAVLLAQKTPIYIKSYGNGMLSTISFRGTSAEHTAVLWNGININIPSLGQSDFSLLPTFAADKIEIQFGGGSALLGSDAIGGSINIQTNGKPKSSSLSLMQSFGSFGKQTMNIHLQEQHKNWHFKTAVFRRSAKNDFPFTNIAKIGFPTEKQQNSSYKLTSFTQNIGYKISKTKSLNLDFWWTHSEREIQPTMSVKSSDFQEDKNLRLMSSYVSNTEKGKFSVKAAFLNDFILFSYALGKPESRMKQLLFIPEYSFEIGEDISVRVGGKTTQYFTDVAGYGKEISENRNAIYASFALAPKETPLKITLNLRQVFAPNIKAPFTPSLGLSYLLINSEKQQFLLRSSLSKNFRLPTLNERYWSPGGNLDILPETAINKEIGFNNEFQFGKLELLTKFTYFRIDTKERVSWLPENGIWSPKNLAEVSSEGIEIFQEINFQFSENTFFKLGGSYSFIKAITEKVTDLSLENLLDKQLIYVPKHKANGSATLQLKNGQIQLNGSFISTRTTTSETILKEFFLLDFYTSWTISLSEKEKINVFFSANNLLDLEYQNYENRAMPKRNFEIGLKIKITESRLLEKRLLDN